MRTLVDHVVNHGLMLSKPGQRVRPDLSRFSLVAVLDNYIEAGQARVSFLLETIRQY